MRALTPDNRLNAVRCAWDWDADNSPSRKARISRAANGLAVSLSTNPSRYGLAA